MGKGPLRSCGWVARAGCGGCLRTRSPWHSHGASLCPWSRHPCGAAQILPQALSAMGAAWILHPHPCVCCGEQLQFPKAAPPPPKPCPGLQQPLCCLDPHTGDPPLHPPLLKAGPATDAAQTPQHPTHAGQTQHPTPSSFMMGGTPKPPHLGRGDPNPPPPKTRY